MEIVNAVKFKRGLAENVPSTKDKNTFYYETDTQQFWCGDAKMIREPLLEGSDNYVLSTNGNGNRYWADLQEVTSLFPYPQNKQTAPLYTNVNDL